MPSMIQLEKKTNTIADELPSSWQERLGKIDFALQPIVNINNGVVFGYEALLRNFHEAGFQSIPDIFDWAYQEDRLFTVDLYLREKAIRKFRHVPWYRQTKLFYNVDNRLWESCDYNFQESVQFFEKVAFEQDAFCIELSEKHLIDYDSNLFNELKCIKRTGLKVAVDDCGSGFSGLKLMFYSEPDYVKIDRFFITDIAKNPKKRVFVSNIVNISHMIGSIVIAEGIETKDEFYICREIGCDLVQGYYVDYPQKNVDFLKKQYLQVQDSSELDRRHKDSEDKRYIQSQMVFIEPVFDTAKVFQVFEKFRNTDAHPFYPVINESYEPLGIITEKSFRTFAYSRYGSELLRNRRYANGLHQFITKCPITDIKTSVEKILELFSQEFDSVEGIIIVENLKYVGFLDTHSLLKVLNEKNISFARDQNPLTKLPGNTLIHEYISEALSNLMSQYIFVYFDFNHFKPYNDKYGFRSGDRVILLFAEILKKRKFKHEIFIGHIGGDDFFMGIRDHNRESVLSTIYDIMETFRIDVQSFYGIEELRTGYIMSNDRDDKIKQFPLLTVSAAVVELPKCRRRIHSNNEIGEIIANQKKKAKKSMDKLAFIQVE